MKKLSLVVATVLLCLTPLSLHSQRGLTLALDRAEARVGRPLTPGSVAGVHRRVHRRAAYGAAPYGAAALRSRCLWRVCLPWSRWLSPSLHLPTDG